MRHRETEIGDQRQKWGLSTNWRLEILNSQETSAQIQYGQTELKNPL